MRGWVRSLVVVVSEFCKFVAKILEDKPNRKRSLSYLDRKHRFLYKLGKSALSTWHSLHTVSLRHTSWPPCSSVSSLVYNYINVDQRASAACSFPSFLLRHASRLL